MLRALLPMMKCMHMTSTAMKKRVNQKERERERERYKKGINKEQPRKACTFVPTTVIVALREK